VLSIRESRTVTPDYTVRWDGAIYRVNREHIARGCRQWRSCLVLTNAPISGSLGVNADDDCFSFATAINSKHQIIGNTFNCNTNIFRTVLWDNGSIIDLNAAIPSNSSLFLVEPDNINDRGEIVGRGAPPGCDPTNLDQCGHVFLLIPCDRAGTQGCEGDTVHGDRTGSAGISTITTTLSEGREVTREFIAQLRARLMQRHHRPGIGTPKY
jgi:hypothetical protein